MRVSIFFKGGSQAKSGGFKGSRKTSRKRVLGGPGALLSSICRTSAATRQKQSARELVLSSSNKLSAKKMPSIVSGKRPDRPSLLLRSTPRKKEPQEKKSRAGCVSKIVLGRKSQACISGGPLAPATFPPISGPPPPVFGIVKNYSLAPLGSKQPKHNSRKKSVLSKPRESELAAQESTNLNKEAAPRGQVSNPSSSFPYPSIPATQTAFHLRFCPLMSSLGCQVGGHFNRIKCLICAQCCFWPERGWEGLLKAGL